jgi:chitodextrinase
VVTVVNGDTQTNLQGYEFVGFDPQQPNIVYAGNRISRDAGLTFQPINFPTGSIVNGVAPCVYGISKDFSGNSFVFAMDANSQKIYRSADHGNNWILFASLADVGAGARFMDSKPTFSPHPVNPNIVYSLDKNHDLLKVEYDAGRVKYTSLNVFSSLPTWMPDGVKSYMQIRTIAIDPVNPKVIYVATNVSGIPSIYRSLDAGVSWQSISDDFPHLPGTPVVNPHTHELFRGSMNGTSIYPAPSAVSLPEANAGPDQIINEGALVTLDGSASLDPSGESLSYVWTAPEGINLSSAYAAKPTFTAPEVSSDTSFTFSLKVNNGNVSSAASTVTITVKQVNKPPVADAGTDQNVRPGELVTLNGSASIDPDQDILSYLWQAPSGINLSSLTDPRTSFTAPDVEVKTDYTFSLVVNDGSLNSIADQVTITVFPNDQKMLIYPNPTKGRVTIDFDQLYPKDTYLMVHDLIGKLLVRKPILSKEEFLDLTGFTPGIYLISTNIPDLSPKKIVLYK